MIIEIKPQFDEFAIYTDAATSTRILAALELDKAGRAAGA